MITDRWNGPLRRLAAFTLIALPVIALPLHTGCGSSGPEMGRVSGKVTYQGQPVPLGTVAFQSVDPGGRNATGTIGPDGYYTLQTENPGDGAIVGEYFVAVSAIEDPQVLDYIPKKPVPPKRLVPEKYENPQTSNLRATVKSGSNDIPLTLE